MVALNQDAVGCYVKRNSEIAQSNRATCDVWRILPLDLSHHLGLLITFAPFNFVCFVSIVVSASVKVIETSYQQRQIFFACHECRGFVAIIVYLKINFLEQSLSGLFSSWHSEIIVCFFMLFCIACLGIFIASRTSPVSALYCCVLPAIVTGMRE